MTIYCDTEDCLYNEEGFCCANKLEIIGLVCAKATGYNDNKENMNNGN